MAKRAGAVIRFDSRCKAGAMRRIRADGISSRISGRVVPQTARHYYNLYFRHNLPDRDGGIRRSAGESGPERAGG
ncbi:hypothetical protein [Burkholderia ubonensis]|uniref:hypothetical protein n=1 Tax=Burkholderia ubonensis TaxID=101571 RepID=UPI0012FBAAEC|nr:hypothetical protein [Burkholderia ubonensis]